METSRHRWQSLLAVLALCLPFLVALPAMAVEGPTFSVETPGSIWSSSEDGLVEGQSVEVYVNPLGELSEVEPDATPAITLEGEAPDTWLQWSVQDDALGLVPGDRVVVAYADGTTVKELVVAELEVHDPDIDNDVVSGTAVSGTSVQVDVGDNAGGAQLTAVADGTGAWSVDFTGVFSLADASWGAAQVFDGDGDSTHRGICLGDCGGGGWDVPTFSVETPGSVWSSNDQGLVAAGETVHVYVNPNENRSSFDAHRTATVTEGSDGTNTWLQWQLDDETLGIGPGDTVVVDYPDGSSKDLVVVGLAVDGADPASQLVWGNGPTSVWVEVNVGDEFGGAHRTGEADPTSGYWEVDFTPTAEDDASWTGMADGMGGGAQVFDLDGDSTHRGLCVGDCGGGGGWDVPTFSVETPGSIWSSGEVGLVEGQTVEVFVNPNEDRSGYDAYRTAMVAAEPWGLQWSVQDDTLGLEPGDTVVVVYPDESVKDLVVVGLAVEGADPASQLVWGNAPTSVLVEVDVGDEFGGAHRTAEADPTSGYWEVDFTPTTGDDPSWAGMTESMGGSAQVFDLDGDSTHRGVCPGDCGGGGWDVPMFSVETPQSVWSSNDLGLSNPGVVSVTVFAPGAVEGEWLEESSATVDVTEETDGENTWLQWWLEDETLGIDVGDKVVVDYPVPDTPSKELVVETLLVDPVDIGGDRISGTATPGVMVEVDVNDESGGAHRSVEADGTTGVWVADFSAPVGEGEGEWAFDIVEGTGGSAQVFDEDGDSTHRGFCAGDCGGGGGWDVPTFTADTPNQLWSSNDLGLTEGDVVQVSVNPTESGADFAGAATVTLEGEAPDQWLQWSLGTDPFEFGPGDTVVVEYPVPEGEDPVVKELAVEPLTVDGFDLEAGTVWGTGPTGLVVEVDVGSEFAWAHRTVTPDAEGNWEADFSAPVGEGDGEGAFDLGTAQWGAAQVFDEDGDSTHEGICFADCGDGGEPWVVVDVTSETVRTENLPEGEEVHLVYDDPTTTGEGFQPDLELDSVVEEWGQAWFDLREHGVDIQPGDEVHLTSLSADLFHIVQTVEVTAVDDAFDLVHGTADPGDMVWVYTHDEFEQAVRRVETQSDGTWTADFSALVEGGDDQGFADLVPGTNGAAAEEDTVNTGATEFGWRVRNPHFSVEPLEGAIYGQDWVLGTTVTVTIDDPDTPENPDYATTAVVEEWGPDEPPSFSAGVDETFSILPGHVVEVSDGATTKTHEVTRLVTTGVDRDADTVSGTADPGAAIWVGGGDEHGWAQRMVLADAFGDWTADFASDPDGWGILDLVPGVTGEAREEDEDADATVARWQVVDRSLWADQFDDVLGLDWDAAGVELQIDVSGLADGDEWSITTTTQQEGRAFWETGIYVDLFAEGLDIVDGTLIELVDPVSLEVLRSLEVSPLTVTSLDAATGAVHGVATPGAAPLDLQLQNSTGWAWRTPVPDAATGDWTAYPGVDPGVAGEDGDGVVGDVGHRFEVTFSVTETDEDGDRTVVRWDEYRMGGVAAFSGADMVIGERWTGLADVTARVYAADGGLLAEVGGFATMRTADGPLLVDGVPIPRVGNHHVLIDLGAHGIDLEPGQRVELSDGLYVSDIVLPDIEVTEVNLADDSVSGIGQVGEPVMVWALDAEGWPRIRATCADDDDGSWSVDFGAPVVPPLYLDCVDPTVDLWVEPDAGYGAAIDLSSDGFAGGFAGMTDTFDGPLEPDVPDDDDMAGVLWTAHVRGLDVQPRLVEVGEEVAFSATVDATVAPARVPGSAELDWGDGQTSEASLVAGPPGEFDVRVERHAYDEVGVYELTLTVAFGGEYVEVEDVGYVVAVDPDDRFVAGSGWFTSPPGANAWSSDGGTTATFGFLGDASKGAKKPSGEAVFRFAVDTIEFVPTSYDRVVMAGRGQVKLMGSGAVNGVDGYRFMLMAVDDAPDTVRVKLWHDATGTVLYDNGAVVDGGASLLDGGDVIVPTSGGKKPK